MPLTIDSEKAIRLLVPIPYIRPGGVERVLVSMLQAFSQQCDAMVVVASNRVQQRLKALVPNTTVITYESFHWPEASTGEQTLNRLRKAQTATRKIGLKPLDHFLETRINRHRSQGRLQAITNRYNLTHCLYFLINNVTPPKLSIPVTAIIHDLFWHFSPLSYEADYQKRYDDSLQKWLHSSDQLYSISHRTKKDILKIFPNANCDIKVIPNSGYPVTDKLITSNNIQSNTPEFYYPSSFGIYKDQLTFLKAGILLSEQNFNLKLTLTGKQTDTLVEGKPTLSQQYSTKEFETYIAECRALYQRYKHIFESHISGLGYASPEEVEACFQRCSCIVTASKYEGFGLAVAEAIVRGLPVICSDLPVFREQAELYKCEDRIRFFPAGDADALADCMAQFINHPIEKLPSAVAAERFGHWRWADAVLAYRTALSQLN